MPRSWLAWPVRPGCMSSAISLSRQRKRPTWCSRGRATAVPVARVSTSVAFQPTGLAGNVGLHDVAQDSSPEKRTDDRVGEPPPLLGFKPLGLAHPRLAVIADRVVVHIG